MSTNILLETIRRSERKKKKYVLLASSFRKFRFGSATFINTPGTVMSRRNCDFCFFCFLLFLREPRTAVYTYRTGAQRCSKPSSEGDIPACFSKERERERESRSSCRSCGDGKSGGERLKANGEAGRRERKRERQRGK